MAIIKKRFVKLNFGKQIHDGLFVRPVVIIENALAPLILNEKEEKEEKKREGKGREEKVRKEKKRRKERIPFFELQQKVAKHTTSLYPKDQNLTIWPNPQKISSYF